MSAPEKEPLHGTVEPGSASGGARDPQEPADPFADLIDDTRGAGKYLAIFVDEAEASLDELTELLLASEQTESRPPMEKLLVLAHRLKGSAAAVGLHRMAKLGHLMEDVLEGMWLQRRALTPELTDILLGASDFLHQCLAALRKGESLPPGFDQVGKQLKTAWSRLGIAPGPPDFPSATKPNLSQRKSDVRPGGLLDALRRIVAPLAPLDSPTWIGEIRFRPALPLVGLKARLIFEKLVRLGSVCYFDPPSDQLEDCEDLAWVRFGLTTERPREAILRHLRVAGIKSIALEPLVPSGEGLEASPASRSATSTDRSRIECPPGLGTKSQTPAIGQQIPTEQAQATRPQADVSGQACSGLPEVQASPPQPASAGHESPPMPETLRVEIPRLDRLMTLAGQLVISKARFAEIAGQLRQSLGNRPPRETLEKVRGFLARIRSPGTPSLCAEAQKGVLQAEASRLDAALERLAEDLGRWAQVRAQTRELFEAVDHLDRLANALKHHLMGMRMVPIGPLFARFKRLLRDMAHNGGKAIRLVIRGEKTELDKRMIDELAEPLIHLVRNAADHGIEPPEERVAAGKPPEGTITLDAFHRGNRIVIQVRDDGRGLDPQRIVQKAMEKGLLTPAEAQRLSPHQIYDLVWLPGLSTAEKVTEVSGRGMGMDIVKAKIEALNGTVEIQSTPGAGTTFSLRLPLTLALLPCLMVENQGELFALPLDAVRQILALGASEVAMVQGRRAAMVHGQVVPIVRLDEVLVWTVPPRGGPSEPTALPQVVVVGDHAQALGLEVDRVLGQGEVVIQSLAANYRNVAGVAGASVLGNGRVALILDIAALLERAARTGPLAGAPNELLAGAAGPAASFRAKRPAQAAGPTRNFEVGTALATAHPT